MRSSFATYAYAARLATATLFCLLPSVWFAVAERPVIRGIREHYPEPLDAAKARV